MEFGSFLDDDLFETPKNSENNKNENLSYIPKTCEKEWFLTQGSSTSEEDTTIIKYKGDLSYFEASYEDSYVQHKHALDAATNTTVRRDCLEAVARSCLKLNRYDEALVYGELMLEESCNLFQKTNASNLLASVYHAINRNKDELIQLQNFANENEWNADVWLRLAICYANISGIFIPRICGDSSTRELQVNQGICPEVHRFDDRCPCLTCPCYKKRFKDVGAEPHLEKAKIFACAYRSRWLYESCQTGNRSFACKRYDLAPRQLSRFLLELGIEESFLSKTQKNMIDTYRDEVEDAEISNKKQTTFENKWFSWIES